MKDTILKEVIFLNMVKQRGVEMLNVCFKNKEKGYKLFLTFWKQEQVDKWLIKNPDYEIIKKKDVLQEK